jgi:quercetin dioxygenase-like cupin family protein
VEAGAGETIDAPTMRMSVTWRDPPPGRDILVFELLLRPGAEVPLHVHPHQEERHTVIRGSVRARFGGADRVLGPGERVVAHPGEKHGKMAPAGDEDAVVATEFEPALGYRAFLERLFELDREGHVNRKGRGNPLRIATTRQYEAEFYLAGVPVGVQRSLLRGLERIARRLGY